MSSGSNVLIALIDPAHVAHDDAHRWFEITGHAQWATCTIIENGVIRIAGNIKYPNSPGSPAIVLDMVRILKALPGHQFWPDDISLATAEIDPAKIQTPGQVTDSYLLALACAHQGQLATFDRKLSTAAVKGGKAALHLIQSGNPANRNRLYGTETDVALSACPRKSRSDDEPWSKTRKHWKP